MCMRVNVYVCVCVCVCVLCINVFYHQAKILKNTYMESNISSKMPQVSPIFLFIDLDLYFQY